MTESNNDMYGKVCLVTGATSGVGWITARTLLEMGASVVLVGHNNVRGMAAIERIRCEVGEGAEAEFVRTDLSSQKEVKGLAEMFKERYSRLDVLINNAGTVLLTGKLSVDGIEKTFALNHLAPFLLTQSLLELLRQSVPSRIVNVSSETHRRTKLNFDAIGSRSKYNGMRVYGQSKLANLLYTYELARRLEGTGVTVNAVHPGFVSTNLGRENGWFIHLFIRLAMLTGISPEEGAETIIYLATSPEVERITGKYFTRKKAVPSSSLSYEPEMALRVWQISEEMTGLKCS